MVSDPSVLNPRLIKKLDELTQEHAHLSEEAVSPEVVSSPARCTQVMRRLGTLSKVVDKYALYQDLQRRIADARQMLEPEQDEELKKLAADEIETCLDLVSVTARGLLEHLVSSSTDDRKGVIIEIRPGTGGDEAALFAADLYRMYERYAERKGFVIEVLDVQPTEMGGFREAVFSVTGADAYRCLRFESGTHRVQRVPKTETAGRIHTSAATVAVLPEVEEIELDIKPNELRIDTFRSSGPGGQSVNKTSSAVRITHIPTGTVVAIQDEKSQHKNRAKALRVLRSRLYDLMEGQRREKRDTARRSQIGSGDRSQRIRTYNFPQSRLTDHRINLTLYSLSAVMDGDLDELVQALDDKRKEELIQQL
jgi:peptide chain release factor 1